MHITVVISKPHHAAFLCSFFFPLFAIALFTVWILLDKGRRETVHMNLEWNLFTPTYIKFFFLLFLWSFYLRHTRFCYVSDNTVQRIYWKLLVYLIHFLFMLFKRIGKISLHLYDTNIFAYVDIFLFSVFFRFQKM